MHSIQYMGVTGSACSVYKYNTVHTLKLLPRASSSYALTCSSAILPAVFSLLITLDLEGRIFTFNADLEWPKIGREQFFDVPLPFRPVRLPTDRDVAL